MQKDSKTIQLYLLYILNLPKLSGTTKQKSPNMGIKLAKSHQYGGRGGSF